MSARTLLIPLLFTTVLVGTAEADKVRINQPAKVMARPGERAKVVAKLTAGEKVTVIGKDGRWLKVRAHSRTGWITRSVADVPEDDEIVRNTRRRPFVDGRGKDRGSLGDAGPDDRIGADALGDNAPDKDDDDKGKDKDDDDKPRGASRDKDKDDDDKDKDDAKDKDKDDDDVDVSDDDEGPKRKTIRVASKTDAFEEADKNSDVSFSATPDDTLYLVDKIGSKWTAVETNEGDIGYVLTSKLDVPEDDGDVDDGKPKKRQIGLRAKGGVTIVQQGVQTIGSTQKVPDNYAVGLPTATLALGGEYLRPYSKTLMIGGDLNYSFAKAIGGFQYKPMGGTATVTPFSVHDLDIRGLAAYDMKKKNGMMLVGRLGFRYYSFQVADVGNLTKNPATIPSEIRIMPAIGGGVKLPKITDKIGLSANLDLLFAASIQQTKGLEDGKTPSAKGICLGAVFDYKWNPKSDLAFTATYDLNYTSLSFGAPDPASKRNHMGTSVSRTDVFHMVTAGITKAF